MTIEKLPSGSYRIRKMVDGKRYDITVPYKPTKRQANELIEGIKKDASKKTFRDCAKEYINGKRNTLSPSTIRSYESIVKGLPELFLDKQVADIKAWDVQVVIDSIAKERSPKTTRNYSGFISSVLKAFYPSLVLFTQLPQKRRNDAHTPSDDEVKAILDMAKRTVYEIPLRLACYGLRRSEICALTMDDLDGNKLSVNKAKVLGTNGWEIKTTKTESSTREIYIDDELANLIRENGMYEGYPNRIYWFLRKCQDKLGIERFPLHYLRHYFASTAHAIGMTDASIMEIGGWKTDYVMKRVYRHAKDVEKENQKLIDHLSSM